LTFSGFVITAPALIVTLSPGLPPTPTCPPATSLANSIS